MKEKKWIYNIYEEHEKWECDNFYKTKEEAIYEGNKAIKKVIHKYWDGDIDREGFTRDTFLVGTVSEKNYFPTRTRIEEFLLMHDINIFEPKYRGCFDKNNEPKRIENIEVIYIKD